MTGRNEQRWLEKTISDEVRKQQGQTPTFPLSERMFEERSTDEIAQAAIGEARERAEIERMPGGTSPPPEESDALLRNPPDAAGENQDASAGPAPNSRRQRRQDGIETLAAPGRDR